MRNDQTAANIVMQLMRILVTFCKLASLIRTEVASSAAESAQTLTVINSLERHVSVHSQIGNADDSPELEFWYVRVVQVIMPGFKQALKIVKQMTDPDLSGDPKLELNEAYAEYCLTTLQMMLTSGHQQHRMIAASEMFRLGMSPLRILP